MYIIWPYIMQNATSAFSLDVVMLSAAEVEGMRETLSAAGYFMYRASRSMRQLHYQQHGHRLLASSSPQT
jgi:hypothetical protein